MQMPSSQVLQEKWAPVLDYEGLDPIKDSHRRAVTAQLLENQEVALNVRSVTSFTNPTVNTNSVGNGFSADATAGGPVAGFDPVLISLIRRSMPNLVAYDLAGVQPMTGPTGLIFAMRSRYANQSGTEAFFNEADTSFSGQNDSTSPMDSPMVLLVWVLLAHWSHWRTNPAALNPEGGQMLSTYPVGQGMRTDDAEDLGDGAGAFNEMAFSIEKVTVTAKSRALKGRILPGTRTGPQGNPRSEC